MIFHRQSMFLKTRSQKIRMNPSPTSSLLSFTRSTSKKPIKPSITQTGPSHSIHGTSKLISVSTKSNWTPVRKKKRFNHSSAPPKCAATIRHSGRSWGNFTRQSSSDQARNRNPMKLRALMKFSKEQRNVPARIPRPLRTSRTITRLRSK